MSGIIGQGGKSGIIGLTSLENTVSDYESGIWTISFYGHGSTGSAGSTTGTGHYTKIGRVVVCSGLVSNINDDSFSSEVLYMTLPITSNLATGYDNDYPVGGCTWAAMAWSGDYINIRVPLGSNRCTFQITNNADNEVNTSMIWSNLHVNNTSDLSFSVTYNDAAH